MYIIAYTVFVYLYAILSFLRVSYILSRFQAPTGNAPSLTEASSFCQSRQYKDWIRKDKSAEDTGLLGFSGQKRSQFWPGSLLNGSSCSNADSHLGLDESRKELIKSKTHSKTTLKSKDEARGGSFQDVTVSCRSIYCEDVT